MQYKLRVYSPNDTENSIEFDSNQPFAAISKGDILECNHWIGIGGFQKIRDGEKIVVTDVEHLIEGLLNGNAGRRTATDHCTLIYTTIQSQSD